MQNRSTTPPSCLSYEVKGWRDRIAGVKRSNAGFFDPVSYDGHGGIDLPEPEAVFATDIRTITEAAAYRKLARQSMLAPSASTAFQTRGSHSQGVAETGVQIAEALGMSPTSKTLVRAIALAHDMGHPPFSHEGEAAINRRLKQFGIVWDHDVAGLEAIIRDENKDLGHEGLGLSMAVIEGMAKRYWRFSDYGQENTRYEHSRALLPPDVNRFLSQHEENLELDKWNHAEGQIAACADWIEQTITDAQDMMTMALFSEKPAESTRTFFEAYIAHFPLAKQIYTDIKQDMGTRLRAMPREKRARLKADMDRRIPVLMKRFGDCLRDALVADVVGQSNKTMDELGVTASNIRNAKSLTIQPTEAMRTQLDAVRQYYMDNVYPIIREEYLDTEDIVGRVFDDLVRGQVAMPAAWGEAYQAIHANAHLKPREKQRDTSLLVAKYITVAMSDQQALWHMENHHPRLYQQIRQEAHQAPYPTPAYSRDRKTIPAKNDIISQLHGLRDTGRLGIHMLEHAESGQLPESILDAMRASPHEDPKNVPYFSISTIPGCAQQQATTELYNVSHNNCEIFGYLLDLSQDREDRIIIPRIASKNIGSGNSLYQKHFKADRSDNVPAIGRILDRGWSQDRMVEMAQGPDGPAIAERQLDGILAEQSDCNAQLDKTELLARLKINHIKAICIPNTADSPKGYDREVYEQKLRLAGAIIGLQHYQAGIRVPVVIYHSEECMVSKAPSGDFTLLGRHPIEFRKIAIDALRELNQREELNDIPHYLSEGVREILGLDLSKPLTDQSEMFREDHPTAMGATSRFPTRNPTFLR